MHVLSMIIHKYLHQTNPCKATTIYHSNATIKMSQTTKHE